MINKGIIKKALENDQFLIQIYKDSACSHCSGCGDASKITKEEIFTIKDRKAEIGDILTFEIESKKILSAALLVYVFPIFAMISGYLLSNSAGTSEGWSIFYSFLALIVSFLIIFLYDKFFAKKKIEKDIKILSIEKNDDKNQNSCYN